MKKRKYIYIALLSVLAVFTITSCESTEDTNDTTKTVDANGLFKVAGFPSSFNEGKSSRAVGTADAGKTNWAEGDIIYLKCEIYEGISSGACTGSVKDTYAYLLTYSSSAWKATQLSTNTKSLFYYQVRSAGVRVSAYYAPNYDFSADGTLTLKTGKTKGTAEYLTYTHDEAVADMGSANPISLTRNYARIRMHAPAGMEVSLQEKNNLFVPAEGGTSTAGYTTTADNNNNAFFYGTWTKGADDLTFYAVAKDGNTEFYLSNTRGNVTNFNDSYSISVSSAVSKGYVIDAYPIYYNSIGSGATAHPHFIVTKEQMKDLLDDSYKDSYDASLNYILCRDIDMDGYAFTNDSGWFSGVFDGNFHTISNYTHENEDKYWGLFPGVQGGFKDNQSCTYGIIKNLTVTPISSTVVSLTKYAGALVGYLDGGAVVNCKVIINGFIKYFSIRGVLIDGCWYGGLIGYAKNSYIIECASQGKVETGTNEGTGDSQICVGGLVGTNQKTYIGHCYVDATINTYKQQKKNYCICQEGIIGSTKSDTDNDIKFESCYAKTNLSYEATVNYVGIFGGYVNSDKFKGFDHCYAYNNNNTGYPILGNYNIPGVEASIAGKAEFVTTENQTLVDNLNRTTPSVTKLYNNDKLKTELSKNSGFKLVDGHIRLKWE